MCVRTLGVAPAERSPEADVPYVLELPGPPGGRAAITGHPGQVPAFASVLLLHTN